ncbi:MAG: hypothetical protein KAT77_01555 [Nanoarchaeota archaeon]|nr:hypothetical protein [Nanoarchaeota archaeon]
MTKKTFNWIAYLLILIIFIPLAISWTGPPPAPIVYYGYAYINGSAAPAGMTLQILANGGALVMDTDTTIAGGYFPGLQMIWDDLDTTGTDEGIEYANNAEHITFKIGDSITNYPQYLTATMSQAGQAILINLSFIHNFPPILDFIANQTFTEDINKCFNITASDNDIYRSDILTFSSSGAPSSVNQLNNTLTEICWTPNNNNAIVGNYTPTFTVTDDGQLPESDSQNVGYEVINVNDAPFINLADKTTVANQTFTYDVSAVCDDIDPTGDTLNYTDNTTLFDIGLTSGIISFIPTATGVYIIQINVTDNWGASASDTFTLTVLAEEKVVIRKNIYYLETNSNGLVYRVTNKIYNFLGSDITDAPFTDDDIGYNGTVNITNEKSAEISGNITIPQSNQPFLFNLSSLTTANSTYISNQPRILVAAAAAAPAPSTGGGGGGSRSIVCPPCPTCPTCPICPICPSPPQELEELPELPEEIEEIPEAPSYLPASSLGALILLIILLIIRWLYLRYSIKRNLKLALQRKNNFHFLFKNQRFSVRLLDPQRLGAVVYTTRKNKEFIGRTLLNSLKSRWKYSFKVFFKIKNEPLKTEMILKRIKKIIKAKV